MFNLFGSDSPLLAASNFVGWIKRVARIHQVCGGYTPSALYPPCTVNTTQLAARIFIRYTAYILLLPAAIAAAESGLDESEPKIVSGMSIVGNNETPKSLYIVPWKTSEAGKEVSFASSILNEELSPVDKSDFIRRIEFYKQSNPN
ncbi:MAG: hypothetical protein NUV63_01845 [Gallionella sp.]|nr:hypothetical protein [Gallionella sp.]